MPDPAAPPASPRTIRAEIAGTRLELIEGGAARLAALHALIEGAETSLHMLFYMFAGDEAGRSVLARLIVAARRGVSVRLLVDGFGCTAPPEFFHPLRDAGGEFCIFHPRYGARYLLRNHQKLVVADGRRAITGGANISDAYLEDHSDKRWRDLWLTLDGAAVAHADRYFDAIYRWTTGERARIRTLRRLVTRFTQRRGAIRWVFSGPMRRRNPWPEQFIKDMTEARKLDLVAAYFAPPFGMVRRLRHLAQRGQVRIITASKSDNNATIAAARFIYGRLLRRGVEVYEYQPCKLHTKLAIVDDAVHIGSSNFDFRSLYLNLEVMLRIEDAGFATQMREYFEDELGNCVRITPHVHSARATPLRRLKWAVSNFLVTTMDYTVTRRLNFRSEN